MQNKQQIMLMIQKQNTFTGSTAAALYHLEKSGFRSAVIGALEAATNKSREISQKMEK